MAPLRGVFASRTCPLVLPPDIEHNLLARYGEPHRAYHTAGHIAELLGWFDWVAERTGWTDAADVYMAIVFHDAIYDPLAKDNEARSADLARELVAASPKTQQLIQLTARHGALAPRDITADADAAHFLDCDMAILGAAPDAFATYDAAIAIEYRAIEANAFRTGRGAFLRRLLGQPRIFLSDLFHAELDARARDNLARAAAGY